MITDIQEVTGRIAPPDEKATLRAVLRLISLTKPPGRLGRLEALAVRLAGISKIEQPCYSKRTVVVMSADHGVCCRHCRRAGVAMNVGAGEALSVQWMGVIAAIALVVACWVAARLTPTVNRYLGRSRARRHLIRLRRAWDATRDDADVRP